MAFFAILMNNLSQRNKKNKNTMLIRLVRLVASPEIMAISQFVITEYTVESDVVRGKMKVRKKKYKRAKKR